MPLKTLLLGFLLSLFSTPIMAGSNHDHGHDHGHSHSHAPVNQESAKITAKNIIGAFVRRKKLDASWMSIIASSAEKKEFNGKAEWIVTFTNDKIKDATKQKLYVFLTLGGDYIATNFTGK